MNFYKYLFCFVLLFFRAAYLQAQAQQDYHTILNGFFDLLREHKASEAINFLDKTMSKGLSVTDKMQMSLRLESVGNQYGSLYTFDSITDTLVTPNMAYVFGFGIYESQPVWFEFQFLKEPNGWEFGYINCGSSVISPIRELANIVKIKR